MAVAALAPHTLNAAAALLQAGELVAFPTETVYGLGADATNDLAVARVFEAKGRPRFNPLIVHVPSLAEAERLAHFTPMARTLAEAFWPGPLTLVARRRTDSGLSDLVTAGLETVALRVPDHPIARALLAAAKRPLAAPSANRSGHVSATQARHVDEDLGPKVAMVLDGGATAHGIESTVLDVTGDTPLLLRAGAVPAEVIETILGRPLQRQLDGGDAPHSPGQLASHYAPKACVRLNAVTAEPGEAVLAFGPHPLQATGPVFNLSPSGDLIEAAAHLFAALRRLDASGAAAIAVMPIPDSGLGEAINDRLRRAAAPRPLGPILLVKYDTLHKTMTRPLSPPLAAPTADLLAELTAIVGAANAITGPADQAPYLNEWRGRYTGRTPLVVKPGTPREVSAILKACHAARTGVVPQAGNTGLVGGQIPHESGHEILLSVSRLNAIRSLDAAASAITVEAGVTLAAVQTAAEAAGFLFPLSMASEGSCCIGGNLATNAGGVGVLVYGTARAQVLGLEAVLADGQIWNGLSSLRKDNTGYDLNNLLIGSEGTLGVITAATLKLYPRPRSVATALVALSDLESVAAFFRLAQNETGAGLTAFEFMSQRALDFAVKHGGGRSPFTTAPNWPVLIELSLGEADRAQPVLESFVERASELGLVTDAALASSLSQARDLWHLREAISGAQKPEGGSIKHDISVPISAIPAFIERADALVQTLCPGARPVVFGHFGDGNVHYNVSQPTGMDTKAYLSQWDEIAHAVHALVGSFGGSISAEHGIGRMKREELARMKDPTALSMMRAVKAALDPRGILNPGKVL